jgi:phospholipid transport system substrate-binding protein
MRSNLSAAKNESNGALWRANTRATIHIAALLILLFGMAGVAFPTPTTAEATSAVKPPDPIQEAQALVNQAVAILTNPHLTLTEERRQIHAMSAPYFDFDDMARSALGYHWKELTPAQRQEFTKLFAAFIEDAYLTKIQDYSGQQIEFLKEQTLEPGFVEVQAQVTHNGPKPIPFSFILKLVDGNWKIFDGSVANISVIANYRNQFNRVINDQGFDALMERLRAKQEELAEILGEKH